MTDQLAPMLTWDHTATHNCWPHVWILEDRTPPGATPHPDWYLCVLCALCRGARCDSWTPGKGVRCEHIRHHRVPHRYPNGTEREVGR